MAIVTLEKEAPPGLAVETTDRPTGFGYHVVYCSSQTYDEMVRFYAVFLGGQVVAVDGEVSPDRLADDTQDLVLIVKRADLPKAKGARTGFLHIAWCYNSLAELMYVYRNAVQNGYVPVELLNTSVLMQLYFRDPEGNFLEVAIDGHDTAEQTQTFSRASNSTRMPDGVDWRYDPEKVLKMLEAGVSDYDVLHHETYHALVATGRF